MNCYKGFNFNKAKQAIKNALKEDIGRGDITTSLLIKSDSISVAEILFKESGILSGAEIFKLVFELIDHKVKIKFFLKDGEFVKKGTVAGIIKGNTSAILKGERTALNILQRMCGIATNTSEMISILNNSSIKLLDTRKTTPGFRMFEKLAVKTGGGYNHRQGLYDMYLIKDNHIEANSGIENVLIKLKKNKSRIRKKVEIEVKNLKELETVIKSGEGIIDRIMLDNFNYSDIKKAVKMTGKKFEIELSGGINKNNIRSYGKLNGVDYISAGFLTHSAKSLDVSLNFIT